jgi:hypothetical protein
MIKFQVEPSHIIHYHIRRFKMSKDAVLSVVYSPVAGFPEGSAVASISVKYTDANGVEVVASGTPDQAEITITLGAGTWSGTVVTLDASGNQFGAVLVISDSSGATSFLVVDVVTVSLSLPSTATVSLT